MSIQRNTTALTSMLLPLCSLSIHIKMDFAHEVYNRSWMPDSEFYNLIYCKFSPCIPFEGSVSLGSMRAGFEFAFLWPIFPLPFLLLCNACHCTLSSQHKSPEWAQKKWATASLSAFPLPTPFI